MPTATLTMSGSVTGLPTGSQILGPLTITNTSGGAEVTILNSSSGDNTITKPSGGTYVGALIVPPSGNTATLKLKKAAGDTGITIHPTHPMVLSLASAETDFILNVSAANVLIEIKWV